MGNEAKCIGRFGKQQSEGKALLETAEVLFRGGFRLKIPFYSIKSARAVDGELCIQTPEGLAIFKLAGAAAKWCDKILRPKSRLEKLGVKPGSKVSLLGDFEEGFLQELGEQTNAATKNKLVAGSEWLCLAADSHKGAAQASKLAQSL